MLISIVRYFNSFHKMHVINNWTFTLSQLKICWVEEVDITTLYGKPDIMRAVPKNLEDFAGQDMLPE